MKALPGSAGDDAELAARMQAMGIHEADFEETFVRSTGPGGQNVNKTSTCVVLRHTPSGLQVRCQNSRYQGVNRLLARQLLLDRIESTRKARAAAEKSRLEKARRQQRPRSFRAKQRMLAFKTRRSARKQLRGKPQTD